MSFAIINLLSNVFMTGFAFIGIGTTINKVGKFFKVIDENKQNGFKAGFDVIMLDSIEEINRCIESFSIITNNCNKIFFIVYDILMGNKYIKKDKEGKIIICNKSKIFSGYKDKIEELNGKVKKYQQELSKIKKKKNNNLSHKNLKKSNETSIDGLSDNGLSLAASSDDGSSLDGSPLDGSSLDGSSLDGSSLAASSDDGSSLDGSSLDALSVNGSSHNLENEKDSIKDDNETYSEVSSVDEDKEFYLET
jgi:hypothetical protein